MKLIILIIVIFIIFLVISELDRVKGRKDIPDLKMYYTSSSFTLSPYNSFIKLNSNNQSFPSLEKNFPNHKILKNNWRQIKEEILTLIDKGKVTNIQGEQFFDKNITDDGKWKKYYLKWYSPISKKDRNNCPITASLLDKIPEIQLAMFSVLEPGGIIKPHIGPFKGSYRYHLGLETPNNEDCFISVDGDKYSWKDGEDVLFDDTFKHYVHNNTDKRRVILFCDVKRKLNNSIANNINDFVCKYLAPITTRSNEKNEKVTYE